MSDDPLRDALADAQLEPTEAAASDLRRALYRRGYAIVRIPGESPLQRYEDAWRDVYDEGYRAGRADR